MGNSDEERYVEQFSLTLALSKESEESQKIDKPTKRLMVGAGARFLFYPTLLYNIVRHTFEAEFRWWDQIDQFLLLGAVPFPRDVSRLKSIGVHAVVTLNEPFETLVPASMYKDHGINHLVIPTRDYVFAPSFGDIQRAVAFIHEHVQQAETTYVHCKAGRGRSSTIVLCYLVEYRGMTPLEALNYVQSKRPRVLLANAQWKAVQDFSKLCRRRLEANSHYSEASSAPALPISSTSAPSSSTEACTSNPSQGLEGGVTSDRDEECYLTEDTPVFVSNMDLVGYDAMEGGGNEIKYWQEVGAVYRLRLLAIKNVVAAAKTSVAWAKLSSLRLGSYSQNPILDINAVNQVPSAEAANCNRNMTVSNFEEKLPFARIDVAVCLTGLVKC